MGLWSSLFGKQNTPPRTLAVDLDKDARRIHALAFMGPTNDAGEIDPEKLGWEACQAVVVLADPVGSWGDFGFQDYVYSISPLPESKLALYVDFNKLRRPDRVFLLVFDLVDQQHRDWLQFLHSAKKLSLVNGPNGSANTAVVVEVNSPVELERLRGTLRG